MPISVFGLHTTHKPSSPLDAVAFCLGIEVKIWEKGLGGLNGVTHETGCSGWMVGHALTVLVQSPNDAGAQHRAPCCPGLRVILQMWGRGVEFEEGLWDLTTGMAS